MRRICRRSATSAGHQGWRVVEGQRAMQFQSDPFLGWTTIANRDYLVRQLNDHKGSIEIEDLRGAGADRIRRDVRRAAGAGTCAVGRCVFDLPGMWGTGRSSARRWWKFAEAYADQTESGLEGAEEKAVASWEPGAKHRAKSRRRARGERKASGQRAVRRAGGLGSVRESVA